MRLSRGRSEEESVDAVQSTAGRSTKIHLVLNVDPTQVLVLLWQRMIRVGHEMEVELPESDSSTMVFMVKLGTALSPGGYP